MSGEGPILRIRSFRAMWQLYLEVLWRLLEAYKKSKRSGVDAE
jgi:hypothetical protein